MNDPAVVPPPAKNRARLSRWLAFAALTSFVLMIAAAMWLRHQRAIVQCRLDVLSWGGELDVRPASSGSIGRLFDRRYAEEVVGVRLIYSQITDEDLSRLSVFESLELLVLAQSPISDAGMKHVAELTSVRRLNLIGTEVTAAGLVVLSDMPNLEEIWIGADATNDELEALARIESLKFVNVMDSPVVDDDGLEALKQLPSLKRLRIGGASIADTAASQFRRSRPDVELILVDLR